MQLRSDLEDICKVRETLVNATDPDCYQSFVTDLREVLPNATIFLPGKIIPLGIQVPTIRCHCRSCPTNYLNKEGDCNSVCDQSGGFF